MKRLDLLNDLLKNDDYFTELSPLQLLDKSKPKSGNYYFNSVHTNFSPIWAAPSTFAGFCKSCAIGDYYVGWFTDKVPTLGISDERDMYLFWTNLMDAPGMSSTKNFANMLISCINFYPALKEKPEHITVIPATVAEYIQSFGDTLTNKLVFEPFEKEYVFETDHIANMRGKRLARKRSGCRRYERPPYKSQTLTEYFKEYSHPFELERCIRLWYNNQAGLQGDRINDDHTIKNTDFGFQDYEMTLCLISNLQLFIHCYPEYKLDGIIVKDEDGHIIGFTLTALLSDNNCCCILRFTTDDHQYLTDYLLSRSAALYPQAEFFNDSNDGGLEGLAKFKERYLTENAIKNTPDYVAVLPYLKDR